MSQESIVQTSEGTGRGTGRLSFFPSCYWCSLAVTDNLPAFLCWLDLRRRKGHHLFERRVVRAIKPSPVGGEKRQALRKPRQGGSPSSALLAWAGGPQHACSEKQLLPIAALLSSVGTFSAGTARFRTAAAAFGQCTHPHEPLLSALGDAGSSTPPCPRHRTRPSRLCLKDRGGCGVIHGLCTAGGGGTDGFSDFT